MNSGRPRYSRVSDRGEGGLLTNTLKGECLNVAGLPRTDCGFAARCSAGCGSGTWCSDREVVHPAELHLCGVPRRGCGSPSECQPCRDAGRSRHRRCSFKRRRDGERRNHHDRRLLRHHRSNRFLCRARHGARLHAGRQPDGRHQRPAGAVRVVRLEIRRQLRAFVRPIPDLAERAGGRRPDGAAG